MTRIVAVRRSGGFAGTVRSGEVDLDGDDPRASPVNELLDRIDVPAELSQGGAAHPDGFVYDLDVCGEQARLFEGQLSDPLRALVRLVLEA